MLGKPENSKKLESGRRIEWKGEVEERESRGEKKEGKKYLD